MVDDIIDPADTRRVIIDALEGAADEAAATRLAQARRSTGMRRATVAEVKAELVGQPLEDRRRGRAGVEEDDTLMILESMKMEIPITSSDHRAR